MAAKRKQIASQYQACITFRQHPWEFTTVHREGRHYIQGMRCMRCGTERLYKIDGSSGAPAGNRYHYPDGYLIPGGLTAHDRAQARLEWCRGHSPSHPKVQRGLRAVKDAG